MGGCHSKRPPIDRTVGAAGPSTHARRWQQPITRGQLDKGNDVMRSFFVGFVSFCFVSIGEAQDALQVLEPSDAAKRVNQQVVVEMRVNSTGGVRNSYLNSATDFSQA